LKDINITVKKNQAYGLLGSNGSEKSTILKIMTGFMKQDSGVTLIMGRNILDNLFESRKTSSFV
jgi:ABC-type multidrug transport system ATPase subunit